MSGKEPLIYKPVKDLDTSHINAILLTQAQISIEMRKVLEAELNYRDEQGIKDDV